MGTQLFTYLFGAGVLAIAMVAIFRATFFTVQQRHRGTPAAPLHLARRTRLIMAEPTTRPRIRSFLRRCQAAQAASLSSSAGGIS